jgi:hypothetical protein
MSEDSKNFIRLFKAGLPNKGKGRISKRYKIDCLKPGEPTQYHEYFDELIGGNAQVIFTSPK